MPAKDRQLGLPVSPLECLLIALRTGGVCLAGFIVAAAASLAIALGLLRLLHGLLPGSVALTFLERVQPVKGRHPLAHRARHGGLQELDGRMGLRRGAVVLAR